MQYTIYHVLFARRSIFLERVCHPRGIHSAISNNSLSELGGSPRVFSAAAYIVRVAFIRDIMRPGDSSPEMPKSKCRQNAGISPRYRDSSISEGLD